jgi:hypothetical protein
MAFDSELRGIPMKKSNALVLLLLLFLAVIGVAIVGRNLSMPEKTSNDNTSMQKCMHPAYGEFNTKLIKLSKRKIVVHAGEQAEVKGNITGKEYQVGAATCYYDGNLTLKVYLGPKTPKDSWSYMAGKLSKVEGLTVKITPQKFWLKPNETLEFQVGIAPQKAGTYYLYIVAFGEKGWKSWDVIEVEVS